MKKHSHGRAPPRSMRSRLFEKGYRTYEPGNGQISFGENLTGAKSVVKLLHSSGLLAQVVPLRHMDGGVSYCVMYKER
jgi:hypothetical protein